MTMPIGRNCLETTYPKDLKPLNDNGLADHSKDYLLPYLTKEYIEILIKEGIMQKEKSNAKKPEMD